MAAVAKGSPWLQYYVGALGVAGERDLYERSAWVRLPFALGRVGVGRLVEADAFAAKPRAEPSRAYSSRRAPSGSRSRARARRRPRSPHRRARRADGRGGGRGGRRRGAA